LDVLQGRKITTFLEETGALETINAVDLFRSAPISPEFLSV
jgi:hypothetical protein